MNVEVTETGTCTRRVEFQIEPEAIEQDVKERVREYRRSRNLPGFRPGRVPEGIIRKRFGKEIREEVLRTLKYKGLIKALEDNDLELVSEPELAETETDGTVVYSGEIQVKPQVEIVDYKEIEVTRETKKTTDEAVDEYIERIRQSRADEVSVERPVEDGDVVSVTMKEIDPSGVPIIGAEERDRRWQVGGNTSFSKDLDEKIVGMSVDEERNLSYKPSVADSDEEGEEQHVTLTLKSVAERQVPELDEDFVAELGDFENLDAFKDAVRTDLEGRASSEADYRVRMELRDKIVDSNVFDVPEAMVERALANMIENQKRYNQELDEEAFRTDHKEDAVKNVRREIAIEGIAKQEELSVDEDRLNGHIARMAAQYRAAPEQMRAYLEQTGRIDVVRSDLLEEVVLEFLQENAKIEEKEID